MSPSKIVWIKEGYFIFSREGTQGLNVERIARQINKNKSSYYYYFGDLDIFVEALLDYHLERADQIAALGRQCKNMDPDVINLMVDTKDDLFFSKQLRLNLKNPAFKRCFDKSFKIITDSFMDQWTVAIRFEDRPGLAKILFKLIVDNFFLQVNDENLTYEWFHEYMNEIRFIIEQVRSHL